MITTKRNVAFTICTYSYIGLAKILEGSFTRFNSDVDFFIFVIDDIRSKEELPKNIISIKELELFSKNKWIELAFKFGLTEFCTTLKPFIFNWLFANTDAEKICYFDPDLYFFDATDVIFNELDSVSICLTPHFLTFPETDLSKHFEDEIRFTGLYNLGFLGLKKTDKTLKMLNWWGNNLLEKGFNDERKFQFTDQKWMDFMSIYYLQSEVLIVNSMGWNVAPWNYFERKIVLKGQELYVENRNETSDCAVKLLFVHFSGYNYKELIKGVVKQNNTLHDIKYDDIELVTERYKADFIKNRDVLESYFSNKYTYGYYTDGIAIDNNQRKLYKSLLINKIQLTENPFDSKGVFYKKLMKLGMLSSSDYGQNLNSNNYKHLERKMKKVSFFLRLVYKILGYRKYSLLLRLFGRLSTYENHIFLIDKDYFSWV